MIADKTVDVTVLVPEFCFGTGFWLRKRKKKFKITFPRKTWI